jgi:hypothetical protein
METDMKKAAGYKAHGAMKPGAKKRPSGTSTGKHKKK